MNKDKRRARAPNIEGETISICVTNTRSGMATEKVENLGSGGMLGMWGWQAGSASGAACCMTGGGLRRRSIHGESFSEKIREIFGTSR
jgi:hypothetical protein